MDQPAKRDLEEVMQFDPEEGIIDLDTHLDRLKEEADLLAHVIRPGAQQAHPRPRHRGHVVDARQRGPP